MKTGNALVMDLSGMFDGNMLTNPGSTMGPDVREIEKEGESRTGQG